MPRPTTSNRSASNRYRRCDRKTDPIYRTSSIIRIAKGFPDDVRPGVPGRSGDGVLSQQEADNLLTCSKFCRIPIRLRLVSTVSLRWSGEVCACGPSPTYLNLFQPADDQPPSHPASLQPASSHANSAAMGSVQPSAGSSHRTPATFSSCDPNAAVSAPGPDPEARAWPGAKQADGAVFVSTTLAAHRWRPVGAIFGDRVQVFSAGSSPWGHREPSGGHRHGRGRHRHRFGNATSLTSDDVEMADVIVSMGCGDRVSGSPRQAL